MMSIVDREVKAFIEDVASDSPTPGGGSVAALSGAIGTALCKMVAELTIGKSRYSESQADMKNVRKKAELLMNDFTVLVDQDTEAYKKVLAAFRMPKESSKEKENRDKAIQDGLKLSSLVPMKTLEKSREAVFLVEEVILKGNANCITDAGVAAELISVSSQGAIYNIFINLLGIRDESFSSVIRKEARECKNEIHDRVNKIRIEIERRLNLR